MLANGEAKICTVGFDVSARDPAFKQHAARGIGRYVKNVVPYLEEQSDGVLDVQHFDHTLFHLPNALEKGISLLPAGRQTVRQQLVYPLQLRRKTREKFQFLHFPAHVDAPSWSNVPFITTVHDLIPLVLRDLYEPESGWRFRFARFLELRAIRNAHLVIAISDCTARDIHRILDVPYEKMAIVPMGVEEGFFTPLPPQRVATIPRELGFDDSRETVLYVGGIDQRKNINGLLGSFRMVLERAKARGMRKPLLLMAGKIENDRQYPSLLRKLHELKLSEDVHLTGYVSDDQLRALYRYCKVFFFPSLYEGFGLPVLEAMAAGIPVVCSRNSSLPEVAGETCLLVDPTNYDEASEAILELLGNQNLSRDLTEQATRRARTFTWERTAGLTLEVYKRVANELGFR